MTNVIVPRRRYTRDQRVESKPATPEQRRRLRAWRQAHRRFAARWRATHGDAIPTPVLPIIPADLVGLLCGAKTRAGTPCRLPGLWPSGRCRLHGGRSTGPRTATGKQRSAANGLRPKQGRLISGSEPHEGLPGNQTGAGGG
jgi:hypothetical protein